MRIPRVYQMLALVSGLTREELHSRYVSVKRFMETHDRMGMRWKGGEIDFFENMPIIVLLYPKKWTEYLEKVGISRNKQLNWRRKLVDEIVKELGRPQELEEDCFSSQVVFHRTKNRCETIGKVTSVRHALRNFRLSEINWKHIEGTCLKDSRGCRIVFRPRRLGLLESSRISYSSCAQHSRSCRGIRVFRKCRSTEAVK